MDYHFEEVQKLLFYVYDIDDKNNDISQADFLGKCECTLGQVNHHLHLGMSQVFSGSNIIYIQVVSACNFKRPLDYNGRPYGSISIHAQEQGGMQKSVKMKVRGVKLDKKDWFGKFCFSSF